MFLHTFLTPRELWVPYLLLRSAPARRIRCRGSALVAHGRVSVAFRDRGGAGAVGRRTGKAVESAAWMERLPPPASVSAASLLSLVRTTAHCPVLLAVLASAEALAG